MQLQALEHVRECPDCGLFQRLPELSPGHLARCARCKGRLGRNNADTTILTPLALSASSALLYLLAVIEPLLTFDIYGRSRSITLVTGPLELVREGWIPVGVLVVLATVVFPAVVIVLMLLITSSLAGGDITPATARRIHWYNRLRPWSMAEVYILGVFVAYSKLIDLARVEIGYAVYAVVGLMITMAATDATFRIDRIWQRKPITCGSHHGTPEKFQPPGLLGPEVALPPAWRLISCSACDLVCSAPQPISPWAPAGPCPRCGNTLRQRKPDSLRRTIALLSTATILYIPANLYPIMTVIKLYRGGGHTIVNGVRELYASGMLPLALLVFFASITVPVLKILSLAFMTLGTWFRASTCLVDRSRLYRIVVFIGRWSMIDVFMVSILVGLVQFESLGNITANAGIEAFAAVVVLTIFAADAFDPRLMWDEAGLNGARHPRRRAAAQQEAVTA